MSRLSLFPYPLFRVTGEPSDGPDDNHEGQQGDEQDNQSEEDTPSDHIHLAVGTADIFWRHRTQCFTDSTLVVRTHTVQ